MGFDDGAGGGGGSVTHGGLEKEEVNGSADGGAKDDGEDEEKEKRGMGAAIGGDDDGRALREVAGVAIFGGFAGFGGLSRLGLAVVDVFAGGFVTEVGIDWGYRVGATGGGVGEGALLDVNGFEEEG